MRVVKAAALIFYAVILAAAFYYQIVGDAGIEAYERQESYHELTLSKTIQSNTASLSMRILLLAAGFCLFLLLSRFMRHVLSLRKRFP